MNKKKYCPECGKTTTFENPPYEDKVKDATRYQCSSCGTLFYVIPWTLGK